MKNIILVLFCFVFSKTLFSQGLYNFNLSQYCGLFVTGVSGNPPFDPFYINSNNCTLPWEVAHGTPQIVKSTNPNIISKGILMGSAGSAYVGDGSDNKGKISEGVFYRHRFLKNRRYRIKGTLEGNSENFTDKFSIALANGLQSVTTVASETNSLSRRSYTIPNISSKQIVYTKTDIAYALFDFDITFYPNGDYDYLWLFPEDGGTVIYYSDGSYEGGAAMIVWNLDMPCDQELTTSSLIINSTESVQNIYGNNYNIHTALYPLYQGGNISIPCTNGAVKVVNSSSILPVGNTTPVTFPADPPVLIEASKSISIFKIPTETNSRFFEVEYGRTFEARINNACFKDDCNAYIPWDDNNVRFTWLYKFKYQGASNPVWEINSIGYPIPFNAYKYRLIIFNSWGGKIYDKSFEDRANGINTASIKVYANELLGGVIPAGNLPVCAFELFLENCNGSRLITGDITPVGYTNSNDDNIFTSLWGNKNEILSLNSDNTQIGSQNKSHIKDYSFNVFP